jgi:hypothetical protein
MPTISQLTAVSSVQDTDQIPVYSTNNGDARKASLSTLKAYLFGTTSSSVISVTATAPVVSSGGPNPVISMAAASASANGYLTSTDWSTFNSKGNGTVTSVAALTLGTAGTDVSSTVATGTTTPVITLNLPTASAVNRGLLSSTDYTAFTNKQAALVSGTNIKTVGGVSLLGAGDVGTLGVAYGGTGLTAAGTAGYVVTSDGTNFYMAPAPGAAGSVSSFSGGTTGLLPNTASTGAITLSGTLAVANGGTGLATLTANNILIGNGTSTPTFVAPGSNGNVLTSNGTAWTSSAPAAGVSLATVFAIAAAL